MREITFRGQTRRFGEKVNMAGTPLPSNWVYGGVFKGTGDFSIIYGWSAEEIDTEAYDLKKHTVYTNTLGQYTGFTDDNGHPIYDGDILSVSRRTLYPRIYGNEDTDDVFLISWNQAMGSWAALNLRCIGIPNRWEYLGIIMENPRATRDTQLKFSVIGNRYDNPDLIPEGLVMPDD